MRRNFCLALTVLCVALAAPTACTRAPEPTALPTEARVISKPMGTDTMTPTPTDTPTPTASPLPSKTPVGGSAAGPEATYLAGEPQCAVPRAAELITFTLAEAPDDVRAAWSAQAEHTFAGEVESADADRRTFRVRPVDPAFDYPIDVVDSMAPLPVEGGRRYQFTLWADPPGSTPSGRAIKIGDETGLLALVVDVREADGASQRVLGGDRAGYSVRQAATACREGPYDACGYQLRAAPLEVGFGVSSLSLAAGASGAFAYDPPYVVRVRTSHLRFPAGVVPCKDPTDWVQSYRIERQAVTPTPAP